jgi:glycosyltransferase involved in cell wall biosynthesis
VILFVRTRALYESYADFWRLVELSGFDTCYADELDPASDNVYILPFLNSECGNGWEGARARIIHFNGEWYQNDPVDGVHETWHMDEWFAGCIGAKYVPVGGHPDLIHAPINGTGKTYDVAYLGYMIPRRSRIQYECGRAGVVLSPSSAWGDERHRILTTSKAYLHCHQHEDKRGVPALRMVVAAAYKLPFISETVEARGIFDEGDFLTCSYDGLADFVWQWTHDAPEEQLRGYGERLYERLCEEYTFRKEIEWAL